MEYKVCEEYIDIAIDTYVDEVELAPEIQIVEGKGLSTRC